MNSIKTGLIKFRALLLAMLMMSVLAGCVTVGPDYAPPDVSLPSAWSAEMKDGLIVEDLDKQAPADWWLILDDPVLTSLIGQAVASNLDLKEARARVREARALRGISEADRFPTIDASGTARLSRSSGNTGSGIERKLYVAGFDATWELDLFGGKQRAIEAAEAELQLSEEDLRDVLVSLLAEVALNYVEVRSFQTRLSVANANLDAQKETYNIAQWRFQAGLSTRLDVEQAKYNLEQTRSQIPGLHTGLVQARNRLSVLLGQYPGSLKIALAEHKAIPVTPLEVAVGVPADALRHRPDVRRAERQLAAQTAQVGVATADLYPRFSLLGSIGLEALSLDNLFLIGSRTHSIGPSITWPVFDAGTIRKNIEVQSAQQEQALIQYEAAILKALEEVENALVAYTEEQSRRQSLSDATEAAQQAVNLAQSLYLSGLIDFTDVLDAQRSLLSFQDQLSVSESEVTSNLITLYKALGGGWISLVINDNQ
ncbi:MAG: efflux transporter outer membrane subunit [Proteobacteria bacterium]|nr:efflux transporter outer membrane subunit [Desulfobacteraceae bacterium]MBU3981863.1 efflux transporter outer membrane subunit [Pseudomonadota bacterium]MBU4012328.1 efflux transporter outer membrane subunit [Pseudomonadota bacterium]MBU4068789.1 efflux transporter outer membrane subunit [Pseudomonadota bacterium]MBU4100861.1 efflux transporter outer membrane subunit [Pseudomonadota bacterium]